MVGAACSPPRDGLCWLRVLAVGCGVFVGPTVQAMQAALEALLREQDVRQEWALRLYDRASRVLHMAGFVPVDEVVTLQYRYAAFTPLSQAAPEDRVWSPVTADVLPQVWAIDRAPSPRSDA